MGRGTRIVVTGLGAITPLGLDVASTWENIKANRSGVGPITRFDSSQLLTRIAAEVKGFDPKNYMDGKDARKMDLFSQFAVAAAKEAVRDANLLEGSFDPSRAGVILGVGIGGFETVEASHTALLEKGPSRVPPMTIPKLIANIGPGNVAIMLGLEGPCLTVTTACASGTDAIGNAVFWLEKGVCDFVLTGGVESAITPFGVAGFNVIQALSTKYNDRPTEASRPFDKDRDGFVMGEGAGILVLERLDHAKRRGAKIYAEYGGYGATCDANHLTAPHPEGKGAIAAMRMALADAGLRPEDIDYINAHGTSTPMNDPIETAAIKAVFGEHAYKLKVSSTKSMTGHCLGAAGGIEALLCVLAIQDQFFPATINLQNPDPLCDLDYVPNKGMPGVIRSAMSNTFGFGGHNGIVVFKKYEE
ncbi:MAG: beta-ketoacyl-ACP synthase II [Spirochaetes bacterium]|nr:beta-ketoacyl-ACP synthase II [Spirochaetota bacterium]